MDITLSKQHFETLKDLMEIAEKHNCTIQLGIKQLSDHSIGDDILKANNYLQEDIDTINELLRLAYSTKEITSTILWFDLYEKGKYKHNYMCYSHRHTKFFISVEDFRKLDDNITERLIEKTDTTYNAMDFSNGWAFNETTEPTTICGFGNEENICDYRISWAYMALQCFADLVCDYLNEPRIKRVYYPQ